MRPVYASQLTVQAAPDGGSLHDPIVAMARAWVERVAAAEPLEGRRPPSWACERPLRIGADGQFAGPKDRCHGEMIAVSAAGQWAWRGAVTHPWASPGGESGSCDLRTEVQVRSAGAQSVVTTRRLVEPADGRGAWRDLPVPAPDLTPKLLRAVGAAGGRVSAGQVELTAEPWEIDPDGVVAYLLPAITEPARGIPLVVVSRFADEGMLVDPAAMAAELAGLAQVVVLSSFLTAFRLTDALPAREWSVFLGAVRVYEPGLDFFAQSPYEHHLFLAERVVRDGLVEELPRLLYRRFAERAAAAIGPDAEALAVEQAAARAEDVARAEETARALDALRDAPAAPTAVAAALERERAAWERHRLEAAGRIRSLEEELAGLGAAASDYLALLTVADAENRQLRRDVADLESTIAYLGEGGQSRPQPGADDETLPETLPGLVEHAARHWSPEAVVFHDQARKSAEKHGFNGSMTAAAALLWAVCDVAGRYHRGEELPGGFRLAFAEAGQPRFQSGSSPTALTMHRAAYELWHDHGDGGGTATVLLGPHVGFGSGTGNTSLKVYWYVDEVNRTFVVGHVGEHLPIPTYQ